MRLRPADRMRPGPALVSRHSDFEQVGMALPLEWSAVTASPAPPVGSGRITIDLGGRWERWADLEGDARFPDRARRAAEGPPGKVAWEKVVVPENFGFTDELSRQFAPVWYRRRVADPREAGLTNAPRVRLRFASVDYLADVWLDHKRLGGHEGSFAPFGFDVTERLRRDSELVVRVQDPLEDLDPAQLFFFHKKRVIKGTLKYHDSRPGGLPGRMTGPLVEGGDPWVWTPEWGQSMTTGGIVGPVTLERTGDVSLDAVFVTPLDVAGAGDLVTAEVHLAAGLSNHAGAERDVRLHLSIARGRTAAVDATVPPGSWRVDAITTLTGLAPWEPIHSGRGGPVVHEVHAVLVDRARDEVLDRRSTRVGLRTTRVVTDDAGHARHLEVNGHPVFVKAVNYIPWQHFAEVDRAFYDRDMRMIAAAHANSVGVHAHVQSPHCYDAADDAGILVFQDFPLQWFYDSGTETNPGFLWQAVRQIGDMAYLLHRHPSVVYYACHNEPLRQFVPTRPEDDTPERDVGERHLDETLQTVLRAIDGTRHVHQASGIGDDVHEYQGSLDGGSLYRVGEKAAWLVSEYGFWTVGPQAHKFGDRGWPPDEEQMREWVSRLSFIGSTCAFAGLPGRYESLEAWAGATQTYGAALAKYQTEWFRAHRGAPFMGYRWHFFADWWGYAGGGLVDVERVPKQTYHAYRDASRPLLATGLPGRSLAEPGRVTVPIVIVNDRAEPARGELEWTVHAATSALVVPDPDGARIGLTAPADPGVLVAVPRTRGEAIARGTLPLDVDGEAAVTAGEVVLDLEPGDARTLVLRWTDPVDGPQENLVHLHCPAPGEEHPPGLHEVGG